MYSKEVEKVLKWIDFWCSKSYISPNRRFHIYCKDCDIGADFCSPDSCRDFLRRYWNDPQKREHYTHNVVMFSKI